MDLIIFYSLSCSYKLLTDDQQQIAWWTSNIKSLGGFLAEIISITFHYSYYFFSNLQNLMLFTCNGWNVYLLVNEYHV